MNLQPIHDPAPSRVFISYAWDVRHGPYSSWVGAFASWLRDRGIHAVVDQQARAGLTIGDWIADQLEHATAVVFLCSPSLRSKLSGRKRAWGRNSEYLAQEVEHALSRHRRGSLQIFVAIVEGNRKTAVPDALADFDALPLTSRDDGYKDNYRSLVKSLGGEPTDNFVPYQRWARRTAAKWVIATALALGIFALGYRLWPCPPFVGLGDHAEVARLLELARRVVDQPLRQQCRNARRIALLIAADPTVRNVAKTLIDEDVERAEERCELAIDGLELVAPHSPKPLSQLLVLFKQHCARGTRLPWQLCTGDGAWSQALSQDNGLRKELDRLCQHGS